MRRSRREVMLGGKPNLGFHRDLNDENGGAKRDFMIEVGMKISWGFSDSSANWHLMRIQ